MHLTDDHAADSIVSADSLGVKRTDLATERTRAALDRTLLAWNRTSMSMITFGFTIYQFFQFLSASQPAAGNVNGPRYLSIALIAIGTVSLILAIWQHWLALLRLEPQAAAPYRSLSLLMAVCMVIVGAVTCVAVAVQPV